MKRDISHFTSSQQKAIMHEGGNILVSAGAGSGKTSVLTERVIRKLQEGIQLDSLVILTFTTLAASEMKHRIKDALNLLPELKAQSDMMDEAMISTFDAFALRIVSDHHYLLDLPKHIAISDRVLLDEASEWALNEVFESHYLDPSDSFRALVTRLFARNDDMLKEAIGSLARGLETHPGRMRILREYEHHYLSNEALDEIMMHFHALIMNEVQKIRQSYEALLSMLEQSTDPRAKPFTQQIVGSYQIVFSEDSLEVLAEEVQNLKQPQIPRKRGEEDGFHESVKDIYTAFRARIDQLKKRLGMFYMREDASFREDVLETRPTIMEVVRLTMEYMIHLEQYKKDHQLYHFSDIMILLIQLFETHPDLLREYREKIHEIMVDEYQDTNDLQERILEMLGNDNVFMVGDVKQSIYGFRNANPKNFIRKLHSFSRDGQGTLIELRENFRSRKSALDATNHMFSQWMDEALGGIDYQNSEELMCGNQAYNRHVHNGVSYEPEIIYYDLDRYREGNPKIPQAEIEARWIASDIVRRITRQDQVYDPKLGSMRHIEQSDFAILMDRKTEFETYQKCLVDAGLMVDVFTEELFSTSEEIRFVIHFVNAISVYLGDDEGDLFRFSLWGLLRSFVYRVQDDEIIRLFHAFPEMNPKKMIDEPPTSALALVGSHIKTVCEAVPFLPIETVCEKIYQVTNIWGLLHRLDHPELREKRLEFFYETIRSLNWYTFNDWVRYCRRLHDNRDIDIDFSLAQTKERGVQLLSMHKSKGLEYPICYYSGLYKQFNYTENKAFFVFDSSYGLFTKAYRNGFLNTAIHALHEEQNRQDYLSERIRLFYVALTRAKEKQILLLPRTFVPENHVLDQKPSLIDPDIRKRARSFADLLSILNIPESWLHEMDTPGQVRLQQPLMKDLQTTSLPRKSFEFAEEDMIPKTYSKTSLGILDDHRWQMVQKGNELHRQLEDFDFFGYFKGGDLIEDESLLSCVQPLLDSPAFAGGVPDNIHQEYAFTTKIDKDMFSGVIDLLVEYPDYVVIVDYKLKHLDDEAYIQQLEGYKRYIKRMLNKPVAAYLYSLTDQNIIQVGKIL
ncbi:MAG: UvrD-helicase domain-containing protein [Candidatus Izemoplasmatales bacterium]|nr:UvrD-helicase domain-containing protein [Candidatus Izemoplasmatales bacterium]